MRRDVLERALAEGTVRVDGRRETVATRAVLRGQLVEARLALPAAPFECRAEGGRWLAIAPAPLHPRGELPLGRGRPDLLFEVEATRGSLARLRLETADGSAIAGAQALSALARSGWPVCGDLMRGGIAGGASAGPAITPIGEGVAAPPWPIESDEDPRAGEWRVSEATARVVAAGHPWLLMDEGTEDPGRFMPGERVRAVTRSGAFVAEVRSEGGGAGRDGRRAKGELVARVWSRSGEARGVEERVSEALALRARLMRKGPGRVRHRGTPHTDALRLIHAEADDLPGLSVDRYGPMLRLLITSPAVLRFRDRALAALIEGMGALVPEIDWASAPILEVLHLRSGSPGRLVRTHWLRGGPTAQELLRCDGRGRFAVHERALRYLVDVGQGDPWTSRPGVGLFIDQRVNRERLARKASEGGHWLNLFAHTGAFTVALLAAGASRVTSVDLSAPYLDWLDDNLRENREMLGADPLARHESVRGDGRRYLLADPPGQRLRGVVLDPPTAAAAGRHFWSAEKGLGPMIEASLAHLEPGGVLLVCRNEKRARGGIEGKVAEAAARAGVRLESIRAEPPGPDFPALRGFPEGQSFHGVLAERR